MSREKGATYLDKLCHKFYDEPKGVGKKTDYVCRLCGGPLETYYCEERLYLVKCADCGTLALVKTANPGDAARVTLARPTLTPQNEWVSVEERLPPLRENVLVCAYWHEHWCVYMGWNSGHGWTVSCGIGQRSDVQVSHWMPLPSPPDRRPPERREDT